MFMLRRTCSTLLSLAVVLSVMPGGALVSAQAPPAAINSKTWLDNPKAVEDYLKSAEVVSMEEPQGWRDSAAQGEARPGRPG